LGHTVSWWTVEPAASTVRAKYGGVLVDSHDSWSGPTDVCLGPDGALYISDFFDQRTAHPDPDANWDRSNGRIYKVTANASKPLPEALDLAKITSRELVALLARPNRWFADRSRAELAARRDLSIANDLKQISLQTKDNHLALQGLWALHVTAGIDERLALQLLDHPYPYVRFWTVRLIGDTNVASRHVTERLVELAATESSPVVRGQLAATAKRLPAADAMRIVIALMQRAPDDQDPRVPWLIWWAIESKAISDIDLVVRTFGQDAMWGNAAARENNLRLIRRYAAEGSPAGYEACLRMLKTAPADALVVAHEQLRVGLAERAVGLAGVGQGGFFGELAADAGNASASRRSYEPLSGGLKEYVQRLWTQGSRQAQQIELALRAGLDDAHPALKAAVFDSGVDERERTALIALLREFGRPDDLRPLLKLVTESRSELVKLAALEVLATHDAPNASSTLLGSYATMSPEVRSRIRDVLFGRAAAALAFLQYVDAGRVDRDDVPTSQLRQLALFENEEIDALVRKHWGNIGPGTNEEKLATMRRFSNDLRAAGGDRESGKIVYTKACATCHQLHGEGNKVGPDLTTANRSDRAAMLANIVDPNAVIRREFLSYVITTTSGRVVTGVMAEQNAASITVLDANNQRIRIARDDVDEIKEAEVSLMPERILDPLTPQQLRDLFSYLEATPPAQKGS
jgi:putative heme-binding domain-containing protein